MNIVSSSLLNYGLIGQVGNYATALSGAEATLTAESTSGLISGSVTGLGEGTGRVLDLQPQLAQLAAFTTNGSVASSRLQTIQTALTSITSLSQTLSTNLTQLSTEEGSSLTAGISSLAGTAAEDLGTLTALLNTKAGDAYVFGGTDETTPPVEDPGSIGTGSLSTSVAAALGGLAANGATATLASVIAAVSANPIFAPSLTSATGSSSIEVGEGENAVVGLPATSTIGMDGAGTTSTGSSIGDLVAVLSAAANLTSAEGSDPQFAGLIAGLQTTLSGAQTGLSEMTSTLAVSQQQVTAATTTNAAMSDALSTQIGSLTSVDLPTVATQLNETQNQLMASYEIVNDLKGLTLAAYL